MAVHAASGTARPRRARSARAFATDRQVLDGAFAVILQSGWSGLSVLACAKRVGLSSKAVNDRHASVSHLGVAVWQDSAGPALREALVSVMEVMLPGDGSAVDVAAGTRAFTSLARPGDSLIVAGELLAAAVFDEVVREAIAADLQSWLGGWCLPEGKVTAARAAQGVYTLVAAMGLLFAFRRPGAAKVNLALQVGYLADALAHPAKPSRLPALEAAHMRLDPPGPVTDEHDALLAAMVLEVAAHGYAGATLVRIMAATNSTEGLLYSRYDSKIELFVAATKWRTEFGFMANLNWFRAVSEKVGPGLADAVVWREYLRPEHVLGRGLAIEQVRTGWREPLLQEVNDAAEAELAKTMQKANPALSRSVVLANLHWDISLGYGAELVPSFFPDAWKLPFDVVAVPMLTGPAAGDLVLGYLAE
jgi:AcrR family transcriptional regulator